MGKEYVPIFFEWLDVTQDLTSEEKGNLIDAIIAYASGIEYEHLLTGGCKIAFRFFKGQVDRNSSISEARSKAGSSKKEQKETNENKTEQNESNEIKTEQIESKSPKEKEKENKKEKEKEKELLFGRFWSEYPRHEAKQTARKAFDKLNPDENLLQLMLAAIAKWKTTAQWQENGGQYIPHPATWLNQRRWEDEPPKASPGLKVVAAQQYGQRTYSSTEETPEEVLARFGII